MTLIDFTCLKCGAALKIEKRCVTGKLRILRLVRHR